MLLIIRYRGALVDLCQDDRPESCHGWFIFSGRVSEAFTAKHSLSVPTLHPKHPGSPSPDVVALSIFHITKHA